ncbi:DNA adenine methylase [Pyxidicoccus fallax]|uniref:Site-specific DNA-methyltransferase (adenine-specific) n=1 Tax=Pyxidicoccus fallax TaxID=394095 RepID=A0A848LFL5_9BACT|nr:DNA adenine methylase [Pyxidicoccus fallax]NMO15745.1 DNA adenine methylase [Pyxidicoccus fallax]NPC77283.1 DNA adenine methylase [Pyxidicoccus fallax]
MAEIPHPIPYQGSKRRLAPIILEYLPDDLETLYEPFCGSAAVSLAVARAKKARRIELNDSLEPLTKLWSNIIASPEAVADEYEKIWHAQHDDPRAYFDHVRDDFNRDRDPTKLLFLLARCVKNSVRFNAAGEFNQSPDKRRVGTRPERMRQNILGASQLLKGRSVVTCGDYVKALERATRKDVVYMDPPYQGTSGARDQRYHQQLDRERFISDLDRHIRRGVRVIISFDGRSGDRTYGPELPSSLGLTKIEVHAGRSSQATLNGEEANTFESLYVSPKLLRGEQRHRNMRSIKETSQQQLPGLTG